MSVLLGPLNNISNNPAFQPKVVPSVGDLISPTPVIWKWSHALTVGRRAIRPGCERAPRQPRPDQSPDCQWARALVFALTQKDADVSPSVVEGIINICNVNAKVLIEPGSAHSFVSFVLDFNGESLYIVTSIDSVHLCG